MWFWASFFFPCGIGIGQSTPRDLEISHFFFICLSHLVGKPQDLVEIVKMMFPALECRQTLRVPWRLVHTEN